MAENTTDTSDENSNADSQPDGAETQSGDTASRDGKGDLSDLLQELRILLQGVQVLVGFLIVLPFSEGFGRVSPGEKRVYIVLFCCVLSSLILFSAPAAQHRLLVPLRNRVQFKSSATRMIIAGMVPFSAAIVLATHFVMDEVASRPVANLVSALVGALMLLLWWIVPLVRRAARDR